MNTSVDRILADLQKPNLAFQIEALDKYLAIPPEELGEAQKRDVIISAIRLFANSDRPFAYATRLSRFDRSVIEPLEGLLTATSSQEVQVLAALLLIEKGCHSGIPRLIQEVEKRGDYYPAAATALANADVIAIAPSLIQQLREFSLAQSSRIPTTADDIALTMLRALKRLGVKIPDDIVKKFSAITVPDYFRKSVSN